MRSQATSPSLVVHWLNGKQHRQARNKRERFRTVSEEA